MPDLGKAQFGQMLPNRGYVGPSGQTPDSNVASEYGGVDGLIQPPPHDVVDRPNEQLMMIYNTQTDDKTGLGGNDLPFETTRVKGPPSKQKAPTPSKLIREYTG